MAVQIQSHNRGIAKRILSTWHDSTKVRTWTLAELNAALQRAINEGLITEAGLQRALNVRNEAPPRATPPGGDTDSGESDDKGSEASDEGEADGSGRDGESGSAETDREGGSGESEQEGDSETESDASEASAESESGQGDSGQDAEGAGEQSEDEGESKSQDSDEQGEGEGKTEPSKPDAQPETSPEAKDDEAKEDEPLRHAMFKTVLKWIRAGVNVALVGPAGTGKSTIVYQCAQELQKEFRGCGALMSKYDLIGYCDAGGAYHESPLFQAYTEGHLFCFDELDASAPDAVVAFNAITDNQTFYAFPNGMKQKHAGFVAVACLNTWGNGATADYVGRYKQDAASMSRFVRVFIDYDRNIEAKIAGQNADIAQRVWLLREACSNLGIRHVVSTRMIVQAIAGRSVKCTKTEIDRDVFFSGLDAPTIAQVKSEMRRISGASEG